METIDELINRLLGTCNETYDLDNYTTEELEQLDDTIFECNWCGWWCDVGDMSECETDLVCVDCYEDNKE